MATHEWTPIYEMSNGAISTWAWLCDRHVAAKVTAKGPVRWSAKEVGLRPGSLAPHGCQECLFEPG